MLSSWTFTDGNGAEFYKSRNNLYIYQTGDISSSTVFKAPSPCPLRPIAYSDYLPAGNYTVYEKQVDDAFWQGHLMWHDVTVVGGETAVDEWLNKELGLGWFVKQTENGENLEGWEFTVYADEECTQELHTATTNSEGRCGYYLEPGTYWVCETGDSYGRFEDES